jgi:hypothetical protein
LLPFIRIGFPLPGILSVFPAGALVADSFSVPNCYLVSNAIACKLKAPVFEETIRGKLIEGRPELFSYFGWLSVRSKIQKMT